MKAFQFSDPAAEEFTEAVRWYEQRRPGWGGKLFDAVTLYKLGTIQVNTYACSRTSTPTRQARARLWKKT